MRASAMVATMPAPPDGRSPAAGQRDRASIIITGKLNNPLDSTPPAGVQPIRLTSIRIAGKNDGTYALDPHGRLAVLVPVRDRWGEITDIVAFIQDEPEQWWCRCGDDTPILGAPALAHAAWERRPLILWETPLQWLLQRRSGSAVLDWGCNLRPIFEDVPAINCQSAALRSRLQENFLAFGPRLTVLACAARSRQGVRVA